MPEKVPDFPCALPESIKVERRLLVLGASLGRYSLYLLPLKSSMEVPNMHFHTSKNAAENATKSVKWYLSVLRANVP